MAPQLSNRLQVQKEFLQGELDANLIVAPVPPLLAWKVRLADGSTHIGDYHPHGGQNIAIPCILCTTVVLFDEGVRQNRLVHRRSSNGSQLGNEHRLLHRNAACIDHQLLCLQLPKAGWNPQQPFDRAKGRGKKVDVLEKLPRKRQLTFLLETVRKTSNHARRKGFHLGHTPTLGVHKTERRRGFRKLHPFQGPLQRLQALSKTLLEHTTPAMLSETLLANASSERHTSSLHSVPTNTQAHKRWGASHSYVLHARHSYS